MTRQAFFQKIDRGEYERIYFFYGQEEWVKESALKRLREKLLPPGLEQFNELVLEGGTAQVILEAAETLPVMADRRLVVVRDFPPLMPGKAKAEQEETRKILDWLDNAPDSCTLVFFVRGMPDMRKKLPAALSKRNGSVQFDLLGNAELLKWANARLKGEGQHIDVKVLEELVFKVGRELLELDGQLNKLSAYVGQRGEITAEDIAALVTPSLESSIFQMIDALMAGKTYEANKIYSALLRCGENRVGILAMLTRQMRMLTHIRLMLDEGAPMREIEAKLALNHYAAGRAQAQAVKIGADQLKDAYEACAQAEYDIKRGAVRDQSAVDALMIRLAGWK